MTKSITLILSVIVALAMTTSAYAGIYKVVNEDGSVSFSDKPSAGSKAEAVKLKTINTAKPLEATNSGQADEIESDEDIDYRVAIVSPANETQIPMGQPHANVQIRLRPSLAEGHQIQMLVNGAEYGEPSTSTSQQLTDIYRGEHQISAAIIDSDGNNVATSEAITIYVQRVVAQPQATPF